MNFRQSTKKLLTLLTKLVLKKHHPKIVIVTGDGETALARELVYNLISQAYPARRNSETPESEFTIPFLIFGNYSHPSKIKDWIESLTRVLATLITIKPYFHVLVIDFPNTNKEIFNYWLKVLSPIVILETTTQEDLLDQAYLHKFYDEAFEKLKTQLPELKKLNFEELSINLSLPEPKIRIEKMKNKIIVDARHIYFPVPLSSVLETAYLLGDKVALFTNLSADLKQAPSQKITANPTSSEGFEVVVLRGHKNTHYEI